MAIWLLTGCTPAGPATGDDDAPPGDGPPRIDAAADDIDAAQGGPDAGRSVFGVFESGSRLKLRVGTTPDGAKTFLGWRDTMRNEDCGFALAADGQLRCVPGAAASYTADVFWGDSGCTTIRLATTAAGCPAVTGYARAVTPCAPSRFTIYALGARHVGPVYVKTAMTCTVFTGNSEYYVLGAEVPAGSFVEATESLE